METYWDTAGNCLLNQRERKIRTVSWTWKFCRSFGALLPFFFATNLSHVILGFGWLDFGNGSLANIYSGICSLYALVNGSENICLNLLFCVFFLPPLFSSCSHHLFLRFFYFDFHGPLFLPQTFHPQVSFNTSIKLYRFLFFPNQSIGT